MSLDFKLHYDRLREGDPTKPEASVSTEDTFYDGPSSARNLCFVWLDGKQQFASYYYLTDAEFISNGDISTITLNFSVYSVLLKGYCLEQLFKSLQDHLPKQIVQVDARYKQSIQGIQVQKSIVTGIEIITKH